MAARLLGFVLATTSLFWASAQAGVAGAHLHAIKRDALPIPSSLAGNWTYVGCWTDNVPGRALSSAYYAADGMTDESCTQFCGGKGYVYAGTEYSTQCYCGNSLVAASQTVNDTNCNMACGGNATEPCGGPNLLTVYNSGPAPVPGPIVNPGPGNWTSIGCYSDSAETPTLLQTQTVVGNLTVASCTSACANGSYLLAGVENGAKCFCGNVIANGASLAANKSTCSVPCKGNSSEVCGGQFNINLYSTLGWKSIGCYNDSVNARTLPNQQFLSGGASSMSVEGCTLACQSNSFTLAGMEYAAECYCANSTQNNGAAVLSSDPAQCTMPCNGDSTEICGGSSRLSVYTYRGPVPVQSIATSTTSTASTATSTQAVGTGTATKLPKAWKYRGCYVDNANGGRDFNYQQPDNQNLTIESCISTCTGLGYGIAAVEFGVQCFCDNFIRNGGVLASADSQCSTACGGSSKEICGGANRLSVYSNSTLQAFVPPGPQKTGLPGSWQYQGCLIDNDIPRSLQYELILQNNNTATNCLSQCSKFGYNAGGLEYGLQCFCGDASYPATVNATFQPESDCNMPCSGNSSYICGGGDRLSYYTWQGSPLTQWNYASGAAAGQYQFLIGGVVIPLITTQAVNGKVTFMEKFGTEPANNSTGAYELDLAQISNFTGAWRPMHVKTDIFCSAGLTLPDRAGRQINIGGWAYPATEGIRLYWPNGSPGVWGTNDWQENGQEVALQTGRWYPTAMIMANGSILVVGGEAGSNGAPVPNLEVLPKPAGGGLIYCDYLNRTDPYNLYPFLVVLPSGGIFVGYYNEARILDEKSLMTKKTLPNIPGAVNDFLGGRSYPFSGTMMIMPQTAPYTALLTVLICGGSVPGPEYALDNCVSIQPDAKNPQWTIERMPSLRVITCMTALPDGTYLIINGAQHGRAGFGTSSIPNLNAVLYDPSQPVNRRMTVMANTTIARLYHSEAILLQDGRVLVSGSDPEDNTYPQEYRVEVFLPPYLLNNATRPTYTIANRDWAYGKQYTVTLGPSVSTANLRFSLLGAESSTHGSSMGQRTLFPAFSCKGQVCTITAPPNAHIAPPGWFQLFVLDGPTPSISKYVRIGGDPAKLGNWPAFTDFSAPGMGTILSSTNY